MADTLSFIGSDSFEGTAYYNNEDNWIDGNLYIGNHLIKANKLYDNFVVPENILSVAAGAFNECLNLKSCYVGKNVRNLGYEDVMFLFKECLKLEEIKVHEENQYLYSDEDGVLFNKEKTTLIRYPVGKKESFYKVPDTVKKIAGSAFAYAYNLDKIELPAGLVECGTQAFLGCLCLSELEIPDSVTYLGYTSITENAGLSEITIPMGMKKIDFAAIYRCFSLEKIYVKSYDAEICEFALGSAEVTLNVSSKEEKMKILVDGYINNNFEAFEKYAVWYDDIVHTATIYCHSGSTAEAYAIENGIKYELTHFYEGEWTYDYDNMIRYRKCIHCDELETEELIPETPTEPDVPADEDTKEPLYVQLFDLIKMFFALIISLFKK